VQLTDGTVGWIDSEYESKLFLLLVALSVAIILSLSSSFTIFLKMDKKTEPFLDRIVKVIDQCFFLQDIVVHF
jgi:hypothetical protein